MPVKVRCPSCEKVLKAPDSARGKALKCPQCKGKVPVPSGKSGKKKSKKKSAASDEDFLAGLDLDNAEDARARICPKCGVDVSEDDVDCPACGVNLETGTVSQRTLKKQARKGPDPAQFYKEAWGDAWTFMLKNKGLAVRTMIYWIILYILTGAASAAAGWVNQYDKPPVVVFFAVLSALFSLGIPGWMWFLWITIINGTLERKKVFKRVNLDLFACFALGIKSVLWSVVTVAQFLLVSAVIWFPVQLAAGPFAGTVALVLFTYLAFIPFPIAMTHLSMPVQWPGWAIWKTWKGVFKSLPGLLYVWLVWIAAGLISLLVTAAVLMVAAQVAVPALVALGATLQDDVVQRFGSGGEEFTKGYAIGMLCLIVGMYLVLIAVSAFVSVFCMRVNGLFAFYFRPDLDLQTARKEVKFVKKKKKTNEFGEEVESFPVAKYAGGFVGTLVFYAVANVISYLVTGGETLIMPDFLIRILGLETQ